MQGRVVVIGASADGIQAITQIVAGLPRAFPAPVLIVQHLGRRSSGYLPRILARASALPVIHGFEGDPIVGGTVYVAPPDHHLLVRDGALHLSRGPEENYCRPALDVVFRSVAVAYGPAAIGIVLTGYLNDGTVGLLAIKDRGGTTVIQDPAEARVPQMVLSALARVPIDHVCRLEQIAPLLVRLADEAPGDGRAVPRLAREDQIAGLDAPPGALEQLLRDAVPADRACPSCGEPLFVVPEPRIRRYRCLVGHAFTAYGLRYDGPQRTADDRDVVARATGASRS